MERHKVWRLQYRGERYLRDLSNDELCARVGDLITVSLRHSPDGKIALKADPEDLFKLERFAHVLEELAIRGSDYRQSGILESMQIPKPKSPKVKRALRTLENRKWNGPVLVKFGERKYMASLFLEGRGRISLAKTYDDASLGRARSDDESSISTYVHPSDAHRLMAIEHTPDGGSRGVDVAVPYLGSIQVLLQATTDFYVYCMAQSCDARLFDDLTTPTCEVDTCVVVTRPDAFKARLRDAVATKMPGWKLVESAVEYVDPFFSRFHQITPQVCKHFRFEYQNEYRLSWVSPEQEAAGAAPPDHIYFELGPLTDCAQLIWV